MRTCPCEWLQVGERGAERVLWALKVKVCQWSLTGRVGHDVGWEQLLHPILVIGGADRGGARVDQG